MLISEASEKYDISPDTLRYYERIGLLPPVRRSPSGLRDYDENDLMWIDFIKCMRGAGLPIEQLARYVQLFPQGDATVEARKKILRISASRFVPGSRNCSARSTSWTTRSRCTKRG